MKVITRTDGIYSSKRYDVYFKTEDSGKQFINYVNTLSGGSIRIVSTAMYIVICIRRGISEEYLYTVTNYVEKSIIDSYLELFPEEKE